MPGARSRSTQAAITGAGFRMPRALPRRRGRSRRPRGVGGRPSPSRWAGRRDGRLAKPLLMLAKRRWSRGLATGIKFPARMSHRRGLARHGFVPQQKERTMNANELFAAAPDLMKKWTATSGAVASSLEPNLIHLVEIRASQINGCANCLNMHTAAAREKGETEQRIYLLSAWHEAPCYTDRERAALGWTEALT